MINNEIWPFTDVASFENYFPPGVLTPDPCFPTSIDYSELLESITFVQPIPSLNSVVVKSQGIQSIKVVNQLGQEVFVEKYSARDKISFDTWGFAQGIYFVNISTKEGSIAKPFVIK